MKAAPRRWGSGVRRTEDPMKKNTTIATGTALRKSGLAAAVLLTALSLSACLVAPDRDYRGDGDRHHHWNNDGDWNRSGWQGNSGGWQGDGDWNRHH
jgi:hypothetical protein